MAVDTWEYRLGPWRIDSRDVEHDRDTQEFLLGGGRLYLEAYATPVQLANFREHWQLQLDLNQAPERRLGHRAEALRVATEIMRS